MNDINFQYSLILGLINDKILFKLLVWTSSSKMLMKYLFYTLTHISS